MSIVTPIARNNVAKVLIRLPPALHERLQETAAEQGVSVNTWIAVLLAGGVGFKADTDTATK